MKLLELHGGRLLTTETENISGFSRRWAEPCLIARWDNWDEFWIQHYGKGSSGGRQTPADTAVFNAPLGTDVGFTSWRLTKHPAPVCEQGPTEARANSAERHQFLKISGRKLHREVREMKNRFSAPGKSEGRGVKMTFHPI